MQFAVIGDGNSGGWRPSAHTRLQGPLKWEFLGSNESRHTRKAGDFSKLSVPGDFSKLSVPRVPVPPLLCSSAVLRVLLIPDVFVALWTGTPQPCHLRVPSLSLSLPRSPKGSASSSAPLSASPWAFGFALSHSLGLE